VKPLYPQKLALSSPTKGGRSVGSSSYTWGKINLVAMSAAELQLFTQYFNNYRTMISDYIRVT
jgi:hypothetical protein